MAIGNPALAARCTSCQTVFRVVPDQLRVSAGWVRCGRCSAVFNAAENLVELDDGVVRRSVRLPVPLAPLPVPDNDTITRTAPAPAPAPSSPPEPSGVVATSDGALPPAWADTDVRDDREDVGFVVEPEPDAGLNPDRYQDTYPDRYPDHDPERQPAVFAAPATPAGHEALAEPETGPSTQSLAMAEDTVRGESSSDPQQPPLFEAPPDEPAASPVAAGPGVGRGTTPDDVRAPSFVRSADRAARWQLPRVRAALGGAALLAVLGLIGQVLIEYRDLAAARWPVLQPVLVAFCDVAGCRVEPARSIDGLAVESSGLLRIERSDRYRLSVTLRNRAGIDLALPALDLSLTDSQGKLLARRVLSLAEIGASQATLAAGREISLQATLRASPGSADGNGEAVAGYTIELFYP